MTLWRAQAPVYQKHRDVFATGTRLVAARAHVLACTVQPILPEQQAIVAAIDDEQMTKTPVAKMAASACILAELLYIGHNRLATAAMIKTRAAMFAAARKTLTPAARTPYTLITEESGTELNHSFKGRTVTALDSRENLYFKSDRFKDVADTSPSFFETYVVNLHGGQRRAVWWSKDREALGKSMAGVSLDIPAKPEVLRVDTAHDCAGWPGETVLRRETLVIGDLSVSTVVVGETNKFRSTQSWRVVAPEAACLEVKYFNQYTSDEGNFATSQTIPISLTLGEPSPELFAEFDQRFASSKVGDEKLWKAVLLNWKNDEAAVAQNKAQ